jgi:hypothetical protein
VENYLKTVDVRREVALYAEGHLNGGTRSQAYLQLNELKVRKENVG